MSSYVTTEDKGYYRIDWEPKATYTSITESEFYKRSGHNKKNIENLRKSVYPTQGNDYLLLKLNNELFPVDYKLVPLVQYLWEHGVQTEGWNQPDNTNGGFISMAHYTNDTDCTLHFLQTMLKGVPAKLMNRRKETIEDIKKGNKQVENLNKKGFIVIEVFNEFLSISMNDSLLKKLSNHLRIPLNEEKLPGSVIVSKRYFKDNEIQRK